MHPSMGSESNGAVDGMGAVGSRLAHAPLTSFADDLIVEERPLSIFLSLVQGTSE